VRDVSLPAATANEAVNRIGPTLASRQLGASADPGLRGAARRGIVAAMSSTQSGLIAGFTAGERDFVRRGLDRFFSTLPTVAEGRGHHAEDLARRAKFRPA
jgi:hypothetical protein